MTSSNKARSKLFRDVRTASEADLERRVATQQLVAEHQTRIDEARSAVRLQSKQLTATAKALSQLGAEPSFDERISFYVAFFQDVRDQIEAAKKQAAAEAKAAAASTAAPTVATTPPDPT